MALDAPCLGGGTMFSGVEGGLHVRSEYRYGPRIGPIWPQFLGMARELRKAPKVLKGPSYRAQSLWSLPSTNTILEHRQLPIRIPS